MKIKSIHNLKGTFGRIASLIVLLGIIFIAPFVKADQWGDWTYTTDGSNVTITGYTGIGGDVVIPDLIFNMPVRNIGNNAFPNNYSLKSIYIGTNVISIGDNAFWVCTNLASINAPSSLTNIGYQAFYYCLGMTNFQLGMATPHIGKWAFVFCWNLPSIGVDSNNSAYVSRDGVLFNKDMTQLIACPGGVSGSYVIPSSVTQIAYSAFSSCGRITEVIIPNSVTHIGEHAFGGCASITNFISLENVTSLSTGAFFNCKKISGFRLGEGLSMIESEVFFMCEAITNMVIPASVTNIQSGAFQYCAALTAVNFLADEPMGEPLSLGCFNATVYYYPWTSGWGATFGGRPTVPLDISYVVNDGAVTITGYTGTNSTLVIPNTISNLPVVEIGSSAFSNQTSLTSIKIPDSVTTIGMRAFDYCSSLTNVLIGSGATVVYQPNFAYCPQLIAIDVNEDNPMFCSLDGVVFAKDRSWLLQCPEGKAGNYTIPVSVSTISITAFLNCANLTTVTVPANVTNIYWEAFKSCSNMTGIYFKGDTPHLGDSVFDGDSLTVYYYPWTSGWTDTYGGRPTQVNSAYTQWLLDHSFATNRTEDSTDYDNDGMKNWQEFLAHTDPTTNIDLLAIISMGSESNSSQISWSAKSNVTYQVMKSQDLMVAWSNAPSGIGGNQQSFQTAPVDGLLQYADPNVAEMTNAFYRVNVVQ